MTTIQLAQIIARRTPWKTLTALPVEDANALVVAMNQALQAWFDRANATHIARPCSAVLHGPVTLQGTATQGSTAITLTAPPAWVAGQGIGSTIQVATDQQWNRLLSTTSLLLPYRGPSGTVTFTLHHDVAPLGSDTVSVCSAVHLVRSGSERQLVNAEIPGCGLATQYLHTQGEPERWQIEPHNPGAHSAPFFVMRVWPLPLREEMLSYSISQHWSATMADLLTPRELPVPEDVASGILLPIALDRAAAQALLIPETDLKRVQSDAIAAEARIPTRTMIPVTAPQWHGTPIGY